MFFILSRLWNFVNKISSSNPFLSLLHSGFLFLTWESVKRFHPNCRMGWEAFSQRGGTGPVLDFRCYCPHTGRPLRHVSVVDAVAAAASVVQHVASVCSPRPAEGYANGRRTLTFSALQSVLDFSLGAIY